MNKKIFILEHHIDETVVDRLASFNFENLILEAQKIEAENGTWDHPDSNHPDVAYYAFAINDDPFDPVVEIIIFESKFSE